MKFYNLPQDLFEDGDSRDKSVLIKAYENEYNTVNNKIILHQNMINLLIKGSKTIVYAEETTTVYDNEFLILSTGNCLTSEVVRDNGTFSSILIYFSNEVLTNFLIKHQDIVKRERVKSTRKPFLTYDQDAFIRNYIQSLSIILNSSSCFSPEFRLHKLEELLLYLLYKDVGKLTSLLIVSKDDDDLNLRKAVESNIGQHITVEELAFLCNVSLSTFKRRFQKIYQTSPQKWLIEQKMKLAAELLKQPQERPGLVFQKIGYENHSSFSETFKQQYGMSPKDYQNQFVSL